MKRTLRIWVLGKSSKESDCWGVFDSGLAEEDFWELVSGDGFDFSDGEILEDPFPDLIAAKTSPLSKVPWGPDAFNDDASNPYSEISNLADGLIFVKPDFCSRTSLFDSCCVGSCFLTAESPEAEVFTALISFGSST